MKKQKRRWSGLQLFPVHLGVFDYTVRVVIGPQEPAVRYLRWYFEANDIYADVERRGLCVHRALRCPVIWIPRRPRTAREHATLAHEVFHAVSHVTRWAAIDHSEATEEVFCHALGHLVHAILSRAK